MDFASLAIQVAHVSYYCLNFCIGLRRKLGNTYYHIMGLRPNYGRNSNILIPDPYHYWIKFLAPEANTEIRMRSNLELLPVMNVKK